MSTYQSLYRYRKVFVRSAGSKTRVRVSRCKSTPPRETKVCPVCDSKIAADARQCEYCQTDLTLFDFGGGTTIESSEVRGGDTRSIDEILASIAGGTESQPEIFETLKNVARSSEGSDEAIAKGPEISSPKEEEPLAEQFICPVCESYVDANATVCPGCGAQFAEGDAAEFECPMCRSIVSAEANSCPECGVVFAMETEKGPEAQPAAGAKPPPERAALGSSAPPRAPIPSATQLALADRLLAVRTARREERTELPTGDRKLMYRALPKLVNEVKALLLSAKGMGLGIEKEKRVINEAIAAGKRRNIERAVSVIDNAKRALTMACTEFIANEIESFVREVNSAGTDIGDTDIEQRLEEAVNRLEAGNYDGAWERYLQATKGFRAQAHDYVRAREKLESDRRLVADLKGMGVDVGDVERLLVRARDAMKRRDQTTAVETLNQVRRRLAEDLPGFVQDEMRKARNTLLELKVRGADLSKPIGILKVASVHAKKEEWREAIRYLKEFLKEMGS